MIEKAFNDIEEVQELKRLAENGEEINGTEVESGPIPLKYDNSPHTIPGPNLDNREPSFTIRGNDALALKALNAYVEAYIDKHPKWEDAESPTSADIEKLMNGEENWSSLKKIVERFEEYQEQFSARVKFPD